MPDIDLKIIVHDIRTYPYSKLVQQHQRPIHPKKATSIKVELENLLCVGFMYTIPLIDYASNIVHVMKK